MRELSRGAPERGPGTEQVLQPSLAEQASSCLDGALDRAARTGRRRDTQCRAGWESTAFPCLLDQPVFLVVPGTVPLALSLEGRLTLHWTVFSAGMN